tara:strand:- start:3339 stop:4688 length:1350 start_codon:yes stop_codon:yes gene_type:complete
MNKKFSVFIKGKNSRYNKEIDGEKFPDKSITHRAFILASQCLGVSKIKGLNSDDIKTTIAALKKLGIKIISKKKLNYVYGNGISGFKRFSGTLNFENSGTGARSFLGILTCYPYQINITGDKSLKLRPFKRLTNFLENIGAKITHPKDKKVTLPIKICGTKDWALAQKHEIKVKSAQITTAIIYAALQTKGITEIIESSETRDHTQRFLKSLKADIIVKNIKKKRITKIKGQVEMQNFSINVPADPSSCCFLVVQTLLSKKSSLIIKNVCVNETRIGFIKILKKMGGKIRLLNKKKYFGENIADLHIKSSKLKGIKCPADLIVKSIDDLPVIWIACALAKGNSYFKDLSELRLKESDRVKCVSESLTKLGIKNYTSKSSLKIIGNPNLKPKKNIKILSNHDHRIAMTNFIAGSVVGSNILIKDFETVSSSFPNFLKLQKTLGAKYEIKK